MLLNSFEHKLNIDKKLIACQSMMAIAVSNYLRKRLPLYRLYLGDSLDIFPVTYSVLDLLKNFPPNKLPWGIPEPTENASDFALFHKKNTMQFTPLIKKIFTIHPGIAMSSLVVDSIEGF